MAAALVRDGHEELDQREHGRQQQRGRGEGADHPQPEVDVLRTNRGIRKPSALDAVAPACFWTSPHTTQMQCR